MPDALCVCFHWATAFVGRATGAQGDGFCGNACQKWPRETPAVGALASSGLRIGIRKTESESIETIFKLIEEGEIKITPEENDHERVELKDGQEIEVSNSKLLTFYR